MKLKSLAYSALVVGLLTTGVPLLAHHGTGASYDEEKTITLKGTVTEWIWSNPHCGILLDVTNDKGEVEHWGAELGNPHQLSGAGLTKDTLKPGDEITIVGHPARSGAPRLNLDHFILSDGRVFSGRGAKGNGEVEDSAPSK